MPGNFRCWLRPHLSDRAPETVVPPNRESETSALGLSAKRHQMVSARKASWRTRLKGPGNLKNLGVLNFHLSSDINMLNGGGAGSLERTRLWGLGGRIPC